jgi:FtsH-binding integral membrane protein
MMETKVWERTRAESAGEEVSAGLYNMIIGAVLCWGFAVNWWMVQAIPVETIAHINPWVFLIGYIASCFFGIYLFSSSKNPAISFLGYNFVVIPFGLIINLVVSRYQPALVLEAVQVTGLVTAMMMILGTLFPQFFQKIIGALTIALICVIIVELVMVFVFQKNTEAIDWVVAFIFCGYIGYDWARANAIPKTVDNAVDAAASLYMDIINLFLRILRIMGRRR